MAAGDVRTSLTHIVAWKEKQPGEVPFVTTLHVLNSAILKLARVQPAERVFRGNQGGVLPEQFWKPNKDNVRGGIELGKAFTRNILFVFL